jgi:hypothetical protein
MDRFPPAKDGPRYQMLAIGRTLDDLDPREHTNDAGDVWGPLFWTFSGLVLLMAFVGWLLVGQPINP